MIFSFSSETIAAHCPPELNAETKASLAYKSSFFTDSPCILSFPTSSRISTNPALFISLLTILAAMDMS